MLQSLIATIAGKRKPKNFTEAAALIGIRLEQARQDLARAESDLTRARTEAAEQGAAAYLATGSTESAATDEPALAALVARVDRVRLALSQLEAAHSEAIAAAQQERQKSAIDAVRSLRAER